MPKKGARRKQKREDYRKTLHEDENGSNLPSKRFYRQRAHANPFADKDLTYPSCPQTMDWGPLYPASKIPNEANTQNLGSETTVARMSRDVEIVDIGCGFGGLLFGLAPFFPETLILGMEIRESVAEFVQEKIKAMRHQAVIRESCDKELSSPTYNNIACVRANSMKFLPNFFTKSQLHSVFLCFPDPHFKARKHKARIVSTTLNSEYAYVLRPRGIVYTITDVEDLHEWMVEHFEKHPSFARVREEEMEEGGRERKCIEIMSSETEEGKKVGRNGGLKLIACFRRLEDPPWPSEEAG